MTWAEARVFHAAVNGSSDLADQIFSEILLGSESMLSVKENRYLWVNVV